MAEAVETPEKMFEIGKRFYLPSSGVADPLLALYYFQKSAEAGYVPAQRVLGSCYMEGRLTAPDYVEAHKWLSSAARQHDGQAAYTLAQMYVRGLGVEKDWAVAFKLLDMECARHLADARVLKEQMKEQLSRGFPEIKARLETWEKNRRGVYDSHRARFILPWTTPSRPQYEKEEFDVWLQLNLKKISPEQALSTLTDLMTTYYTTQESLTGPK